MVQKQQKLIDKDLLILSFVLILTEEAYSNGRLQTWKAWQSTFMLAWVTNVTWMCFMSSSSSSSSSSFPFQSSSVSYVGLELGLVYFFTPFPKTIYVLWPLALCMACIQERLLIQRGLWWCAYGSVHNMSAILTAPQHG